MILGTCPSIVYYISAHGYGHGVRSCSIIRAFNQLHPRLTVHIVSELPAAFLSSHIGSDRNPIRAGSYDVGMVQLDSIRVDVDATLQKAKQLHRNRKRLVEQESAFLSNLKADLIIADIPGIPIEAASRVGIPRIAVGNFGWDWIYSDFIPQDAQWKPIVNMFREQYAKASLLLRLPFCEEMKAFPLIEDIPLVASPGYSRRTKIAALTGCDPGKKWILLSFTTLDLGVDALSRIECIEDHEFFTVLPLKWQRRNIHPLKREQISFSDVIASMDAVISKPGFGILSDCIVNRKPLIYADRGDFLEYPILETSIRKYLKHLHIPVGELYSGYFGEYLRRIWARPDPEMKLPHGGDRIAAQRIADLLSTKV
jgi:hypothetical protein